MTKQTGIVAGTQSVLDEMTAGIIGKKAQAAARLTPTEGEHAPAHALDGPIPAPFPWDYPAGAMQQQLDLIKNALLMLAQGVVEVEAAIGREHPDMAGARQDPIAVLGAEITAEQQADARVLAQKVSSAAHRNFEAEMSVKAAEAQASLSQSWVCPDHGRDATEVRISKRRKVEYRACTQCGRDEYE